MPLPRKALISLSETTYYHCVSRCVRRAYLCGEDRLTGQSFEHRRQWVEERLLCLASMFAIDVCAYAVMNNHTHVVLHVNVEKALGWSIEEVISRWQKLHKGTVLTRRYLDVTERNLLTSAEMEAVHAITQVYRRRLYDISWFMRLLNEFIAKQANKEDKCTGRFWEGRFKSQALLDETALAACMAYVDLNPVRANIAKTPEHSAHTSVQRRISAARQNCQPKELMPFTGCRALRHSSGLPFRLEDYLQLVDASSRSFRSDKRGRVNSPLPILVRAGLSSVDWHWLITGIETQFSHRIDLVSIKHKLERIAHLNTA
ncbi:transposase [Alteromonas ponticola]|uniref:Transposase n=1 Tax=Alteromonas ponticola TaxID=2720613 RepID=A0ABX1R098_9ALTE|nr:transposase [Alteromonas ponticola]NMH58492.1 transposase [Alteromonas ponticola]